MSVAKDSPRIFLAAAQKLVPQVVSASTYAERDRELPLQLVNAIADKGFFRMLVPKTIGGGEIDLIEYLNVIETFAEADGSTAWCINQNSVFATNSATMPKETAREIWSDERAVVANGQPRHTKVVPSDGGYRLTGRWDFSSGCRHATWMAASTPIQNIDQENEPSTKHQGLQVMLIPKDMVNLIDVWQVKGLRGTGSFSFELHDQFVPHIRTFRQSDKPREPGPIYMMTTSLLFASGFACVALGVARGALNSAMTILSKKERAQDKDILRGKSTVQQKIGQAAAVRSSARAFLFEAASELWQNACTTRCIDLEKRIMLRLASTHAIRMAAEVVDIAYDLCGSDSIFADNPIQRRFQDAHVITQQLQGRMDHYETAGQFFLGLEPNTRHI